MSASLENRLYPLLREIVGEFNTPFHLYDEDGIRMQEMGFGFDCSSAAELILSRRLGARGGDILCIHDTEAHGQAMGFT